MAEVNGRVFVITGASTGIGAACALRLDARGYRVFAGVRGEADGARLEGMASSRLRRLMLDVTVEDSVASAAQSVADVVGEEGIQGLVNNAGIVLVGPMECLPVNELRRQFETNVVGPIAVTQRFLPLLRKGAGRVVNMGSITGRIAPPFLGPYGASKHALRALTDVLRMELRPWGIEVSLVEPGAVRTPIWEKSRDSAEALLAHYPEDTQRLYDGALDALRSVGMARISRMGIPAEKVAAVVERALVASRPKARYLVGLDARLQALAARLVPDRLRDRIVRKVMGLPS